MDVQFLPTWPAPEKTIGLFSLNPMFEATAKPPTARIRALATKTASSGRDILEVIMSFASLKLGLNPHVFHCSRRQKDSVHRYLRSNVALSTTNLANFSLDSVENDR